MNTLGYSTKSADKNAMMIRLLVFPAVLLMALFRKIIYSAYANEARVQFYRALGAKIGDQVEIRPGVLIKGAKNVSIGNDVFIGEGTAIVAYDAPVEIGNDVQIADAVYISSRNHRFRDKGSPISQQGYKAEKVIVEDNTWLAHGATITAGAVIQSGSVVGANVHAQKNSLGPALQSQSISVKKL